MRIQLWPATGVLAAGALVVTLALGLTACAPPRPLPALPSVDLATSQPSVRQVIESAMTAARAKPDDAVAVARFGMALHAHHQLAAATRAYERAALLDPQQPDYLDYWGTTLVADGRYADALAPLRASLKLRDAAPVRLRLADAYYANGQVPEARREYETLLAADASLAAAHFGRGRCLSGAEAAAAFERAIELFPHYGAARFALAGVYRQLGRRAQAEAILANYERDKLLAPPMDDPATAAVQALDASATGLLRASQSLDRQGQLAEAAVLQERALAADPKLTQAWVNLISLRARLGDAEKAEAAYRQAIVLEPRNAEAHYNFGVLTAQSERLPEAQKAFEAAVAADPGYAEALDNLGAVIERAGPAAWNRAAVLYRRALAAKPGLRLARYHLGRILANQGRLGEAISEFQQSIEPVDSQSPGYLYALGATQARAGAASQATATLRRAHAEALRWQQAQLAEAITQDLSKIGR